MPRRALLPRLTQILGLLVLCAVGAELLAAYGDTTGDPVGVLFSLIFFGALYGAPALLARDLVRRLGWGWPSLLLLFAALGTAQACLIDQSLFSVDYQGYEGWEATRQATLIPALGISAVNAYNFIAGHVIFSFGAPVAVAEAWSPQRSRQPWLGPVGTVIAALAYAGTAVLILQDPESRSASGAQLIGSASVLLGFVLVAVLIGVRSRPAPEAHRRRTFPVWATLLVAFGFAIVAGLAEETWSGLVLALAVVAIVGVGLTLAGRRLDWTIRHIAAVGLGFLLSRGLLAFSYFPLAGEVGPVAKYAHNVVMLLFVLTAGWLALRPRRRSDEPADTD